MFRLTVACLFLLSLSLVGCGADKTQPKEVKTKNMGELKKQMEKGLADPNDVEEP